jgi:hypothetical protein
MATSLAEALPRDRQRSRQQDLIAGNALVMFS